MKIREVKRGPKSSIEHFFRNAPRTEVYTSTELSQKLGIPRDRVKAVCYDLWKKGVLDRLEIAYALKFYGSREAIRKLRRELAREGIL